MEDIATVHIQSIERVETAKRAKFVSIVENIHMYRNKKTHQRKITVISSIYMTCTGVSYMPIYLSSALDFMT